MRTLPGLPDFLLGAVTGVAVLVTVLILLGVL